MFTAAVCRSHHLAGGVDWNRWTGQDRYPWQCHHLAGGVDWNYMLSRNRTMCGMSPPCGWCGLKFPAAQANLPPMCHHLAGGVDWNLRNTCSFHISFCHHLAGGVDWNTKAVGFPRSSTVTTLRVVWIEIHSKPNSDRATFVTTLRVVWIEFTRAIILLCCSRSPPCRWCFERKYIIAIRVFM